MKAIIALVAVVAFAGVASAQDESFFTYRQIKEMDARAPIKQPVQPTSEKGRLYFDYVDPARDRGRVEVIVDLDRGTATVRFPDGGSASGLVRPR